MSDEKNVNKPLRRSASV